MRAIPSASDDSGPTKEGQSDPAGPLAERNATTVQVSLPQSGPYEVRRVTTTTTTMESIVVHPGNNGTMPPGVHEPEHEVRSSRTFFLTIVSILKRRIALVASTD